VAVRAASAPQMDAVMLQLLRRTWRPPVSDPLDSVPHDIDWTGFCSVVHRCHIAALLYERLSPRRGMVPPPVLEWLRLCRDQTRRKNLHLLSEIQYRFLKWRINRMRRKFDVYSGGRANDVDRRVH